MKDLFDFPPANPSNIQVTDVDHHQVMLAMALLWSLHPVTTLYHLMRKLDLKQINGRIFTQEALKHSVQHLLANKLIIESARR